MYNRLIGLNGDYYMNKFVLIVMLLMQSSGIIFGAASSSSASAIPTHPKESSYKVDYYLDEKLPCLDSGRDKEDLEGYPDKTTLKAYYRNIASIANFVTFVENVLKIDWQLIDPVIVYSCAMSGSHIYPIEGIFLEHKVVNERPTVAWKKQLDTQDIQLLHACKRCYDTFPAAIKATSLLSECMESMCGLSRHLPFGFRKTFEDYIVGKTHSEHLDVYVGHASGRLLQDYILLKKLSEAGKNISKLTFVDPIYATIISTTIGKDSDQPSKISFSLEHKTPISKQIDWPEQFKQKYTEYKKVASEKQTPINKELNQALCDMFSAYEVAKRLEQILPLAETLGVKEITLYASSDDYITDCACDDSLKADIIVGCDYKGYLNFLENNRVDPTTNNYHDAKTGEFSANKERIDALFAAYFSALSYKENALKDDGCLYQLWKDWKSGSAILSTSKKHEADQDEALKISSPEECAA